MFPFSTYQSEYNVIQNITSQPTSNSIYVSPVNQRSQCLGWTPRKIRGHTCSQDTTLHARGPSAHHVSANKRFSPHPRGVKDASQSLPSSWDTCVWTLISPAHSIKANQCLVIPCVMWPLHATLKQATAEHRTEHCPHNGRKWEVWAVSISFSFPLTEALYAPLRPWPRVDLVDLYQPGPYLSPSQLLSFSLLWICCINYVGNSIAIWFAAWRWVVYLCKGRLGSAVTTVEH